MLATVESMWCVYGIHCVIHFSRFGNAQNKTFGKNNNKYPNYMFKKQIFNINPNSYNSFFSYNS